MPDIELATAAYRRQDQHFFESVGLSSSIPTNFMCYFATQLTLASPTPNQHKYSDSDILSMFSGDISEELLDQLVARCSFNPNCPADHINWWSYEKVRRELTKAGFNNIYKSGYLQSAAAPLRSPSHFDGTYPQMSLYVEAVKA